MPQNAGYAQMHVETSFGSLTELVEAFLKDLKSTLWIACPTPTEQWTDNGKFVSLNPLACLLLTYK